MADHAITQPSATTYEVDDLVESVLQGRVRVPEFQRPFRWQREDVRRLFDSIVRGYPIGSLLLWGRAAQAAKLRLGVLEVDAPEFGEALWVVDGQQRITSLACALNDAGAADSRFSLAYDLRHRKFDRPLESDPFRLPLPTLFDLQRLLKWFADNPEAAEFFDEATRVAKLIRQFVVPAYIVRQDDEAVLRDIFDRMNNYGKRLSRAEVFSALHSITGGAGSPRKLSDIAEHLETRFGFGVLDEDTTLRAFLARRGPDVTREIRTEFESDRVSREFQNETPEEANHGTQAALERVVTFLQRDAGVPHIGFLPYRYLLVVLSRFFAHHPQPARRNRDLLRRWFWRAAIVGPAVTRGAYTSAMRQLAACIVPEDESASVAALLGAVAPFDLGFSLPESFRSTHAEIRFALCAMWSLSPRSVFTGRQYERGELSESLRDQRTASNALELVFGRADHGRTRIGNRVILLGDDASPGWTERLVERPLNLTEPQWLDVLRSHAITEAAGSALRREDANGFIDVRGEEIARATNLFLARMTESKFEDTPPLAVLDLDERESRS